MLRRMFAEPWQPRFDRRWLELGRHDACRHSGVVNLDDGRQISLNSITDDHFVQFHTASKARQRSPYSTSRFTFFDRASRYRRGTRVERRRRRYWAGNGKRKCRRR